MKKIAFLFILGFFIASCSSTKNVVHHSKPIKVKSKANKVVSNALKYKGVKYKYGGTTRSGLDCSGVIYVAFGEANFQLPRVSRDMAKKGKTISLKSTQKGDLLFFKTGKSGKKINHVGLVVSVNKGVIQFIHSTTSRGVIVSDLNQNYWINAFVKATRVL